MKDAKVYLGVVMHESKRYIFSEFLSFLQRLKDQFNDKIIISFMDNSEENDYSKEDWGMDVKYEKTKHPKIEDKMMIYSPTIEISFNINLDDSSVPYDIMKSIHTKFYTRNEDEC